MKAIPQHGAKRSRIDLEAQSLEKDQDRRGIGRLKRLEARRVVAVVGGPIDDIPPGEFEQTGQEFRFDRPESEATIGALDRVLKIEIVDPSLVGELLPSRLPSQP